MLWRKSKVTEDVREEKQSYRGCVGGKSKLLRMLGRKSKVREVDREEMHSYR